MAFTTIKVEKNEDLKVVKILLNRSEKLNAINDEMIKELPKALSQIESDKSIRVVIIEGAGERSFSAGRDISAFSGAKSYESTDVDTFFSAPENFPKPVIAAIDGFCVGGGLELAMACDFRIASERSELGQPEIKLGLIPGGGGTQRLPRLIGMTRAKELIMTGERIQAKTAMKWNLINKVVKPEHFREKVNETAKRLANGPPIALKVVKQVMNKGLESSLEAGLQMERNGFAILMGTKDMIEGTTAFREKRKPNFQGE